MQNECNLLKQKSPLKISYLLRQLLVNHSKTRLQF